MTQYTTTVKGQTRSIRMRERIIKAGNFFFSFHSGLFPFLLTSFCSLLSPRIYITRRWLIHRSWFYFLQHFSSPLLKTFTILTKWKEKDARVDFRQQKTVVIKRIKFLFKHDFVARVVILMKFCFFYISRQPPLPVDTVSNFFWAQCLWYLV